MVSVGGSSLVKAVTLKVIGDGGDATRMLDDITAKAEALKALHPELAVGIDKESTFEQMTALKAEMRAKLLADPLKVEVRPDVDMSLWQRVLGGIGFGGGGGGGGPLGLLRLLGSFGGGGGGGGGGPLGALSKLGPAGYAVGAAALLASTPLITTLLGGLVGGGAAAGALKLASTANTNLTALQATQTSAQQALASAQLSQKNNPSAANAAAVATAQAALTQANAAVSLFQKQNAPALGLYNSEQNVTSALSDAFTKALTSNATRQVQARGPGRLAGLETLTEQIPGSSFISGLEKIMAQIPAFIRSVGPQLGAMFRASLPYLETFIRAFEGFATHVIPAVTSALTHFQRFLPDMLHIFDAISIGIGGVIRGVGELATAVSRFIQWLGGKGGSGIVDWFQALPGRIWNLAAGFEKTLFDLGSDIIGGFLRGIEHAWHDVTSTISGLFESIPNKIKGLLGISSPSRVMAELGRNTVEGFRIGLTQSAMGVGLTVGGVGGGTAGGALRLQVDPGGGSDFEQFMINAMRKWVRVRGGGGPTSVQRTFGTTG